MQPTPGHDPDDPGVGIDPGLDRLRRHSASGPSPRAALVAALSEPDEARALVRVAFCGRTSTDDRQDPTLSLPRQLRTCMAALPDGLSIVAHFYDVESGRKDLAHRGSGRAHEHLQIPIRRDGSITDLLTEARQPGRRFDVVICESIDRIARRTYLGTHIEHTLDQAGVPLLAADEPINLAGRRATETLTRRVKQSIAEWYVLELLEKSRGGLEVHTETGFNIGKPPYGYRADRVPHPVPARRVEGRTKSRLVPHPTEAQVVRAIFDWRVGERLGYKAIAGRLHTDPLRYPPPQPVDPARAVGQWTPSAVRDVLGNPKHTGYMVWNRRATKRGGVVNPVTDWVWSPHPTHEPLVSTELFLAAHAVTTTRERSRSSPGANTAHPHARHVYPLRGYLFCGLCGRRMQGNTRPNGRRYYVCRPAAATPAAHPRSVWVAEHPLLTTVSLALTPHLLARVPPTAADGAPADDHPLRRWLQQHSAAGFADLPDELRRSLFDAFRLEMHYRGADHTVTCQLSIPHAA